MIPHSMFLNALASWFWNLSHNYWYIKSYHDNGRKQNSSFEFWYIVLVYINNLNVI